MAATKKNLLDESFIYALQESGVDTLESLIEVMGFMTEAIFGMLHPSSDDIIHSKAGLHHLLQHITCLLKHAHVECKNEIEAVDDYKDRLELFEELFKLYQFDGHMEKEKDNLAIGRIRDIEKKLFPKSDE
jgi:hypothetical protein